MFGLGCTGSIKFIWLRFNVEDRLGCQGQSWIERIYFEIIFVCCLLLLLLLCQQACLSRWGSALLLIESIHTVFWNIFTSWPLWRSFAVKPGPLLWRLIQVQLSPGPGTLGSPPPLWRARPPRSSSPPDSAPSMSISWNKQKLSMESHFFVWWCL